MKRLSVCAAVLYGLAVLFVNTRASDAIGPGFYNDTLPGTLITYTNMTYVTGSGYYLNDQHQATNTTASAAFDFFGSGMALYGLKFSSGSTDTQACIDANCFTVSFYNSTTVYQQVIFTVTDLDYGVHSFSITDTLPNGVYIVLDAYHIFPFTTLPPTAVVQIEVTAEIVIEMTPEATPGWRASWDGGDGQAVAFDYQANAGQVASIVLEAAMLLVLLLLVFVVLFRREQSKT